MKRKQYVSMKYIVVLVFVVAVGLGAAGVMLWNKKSPATPTPKPTAATEVKKTEPSRTLRFAAMGDMLAHDSVVAQAKTVDGYDFTPYFRAITPLYDKADVVFCNPETLAAGAAFGISGYPAFNAPSEFTRDLSRGAKCNLINLATNHIGDKSQAAINATLDGWDAQKPLAVAGANRSAAEQQTVKYFTKNGVTVAFVAFADFSNNKSVAGYALNRYHDVALVKQLMNEARNKADVVVASLHWGTEDSTVVNADQRQTAAQFSELGADIIIGTGPHVLQPVQTITRADGHKTLVWYSIGNMLSSQLQLNELTGGVAGFTVTMDGKKVNISDVRFDATFMSYDWPAVARASNNLLGRTNLQLQPLGEATAGTAKHGTTVAERTKFVRTMLGDAESMTITP